MDSSVTIDQESLGVEFADGQLSGNLLRRPIESTPRAEIHSRNERTLVPLLETESSKGAIAEPVANFASGMWEFNEAGVPAKSELHR